MNKRIKKKISRYGEILGVNGMIDSLVQKFLPDHLILDKSPNILDHSYLVENLTNSKIAETKDL